MKIEFNAYARPGQTQTGTEPGYDPYMETCDLKVDGRGRIWSRDVQQARDALAVAIARDLEE